MCAMHALYNSTSVSVFHLSSSVFLPLSQGGGGEGQGTSRGASRGMGMMAGGPPQGYMPAGHQVCFLHVHIHVLYM